MKPIFERDKFNREKEMRSLIGVGLRSEKLRCGIFCDLGEEYGLTQNEMEVLMFVYKNPELNTAKDVVNYRCSSKSLVCKSVKSLMERNFLESTADDDDGRVVRLHLTEECLKIAEKISAVEDKFYKEVFDGVADDEMHSLSLIAERVGKNLNDICKKSRKCDK